jgi:two-component system, NarL family, sensor kinase
VAGSETHRTEGETLQQRNHELSILNSIAQALNESLEMDEALRAALARVAELLGLHTGWIWLLDEETGASYLGAAQNLPPALTKNPKRMSGRCYCLDTYRKGDMAGAANVNVVRCSRLDGLVDGTDGLRYHACIPLYARGKKLGVLNVASTDWREPSAEDLRLLNTIGDLISMAVERTRLFARSAKLGAVEERSRLARELHDTLAQGLTAVALQLESADALLDADAAHTRIQTAVRKALQLTRTNLEETRRSVQDLRAAPIEGKTLAEALAALASEHSRSSAPKVRCEIAGESRPLPVRIENGVYRIAQEALTNALRHASAKHILLRLETVPQHIRLLVEDDGQGFETDQCDPPRGPLEHYGIVGMNERTRLLGGTLRLESGLGQGTRIAVDIPLDEGA